jgi:hypothetical protein
MYTLFLVASNKNHVPDDYQIENLPWGGGERSMPVEAV